MPNTRYRRGKAYAADMAVDKSTVSRTSKRGEKRLQRCLRYGAEAYLRSMGP